MRLACTATANSSHARIRPCFYTKLSLHSNGAVFVAFLVKLKLLTVDHNPYKFNPQRTYHH